MTSNSRRPQVTYGVQHTANKLTVSASGLQWGDYYACKPKKNLEQCPGAVASAAPTPPHRVPGISDGIFAGAGAGTDIGGGGVARVHTYAYGGDGSTLLFHFTSLHHHTSHSTRILLAQVHTLWGSVSRRHQLCSRQCSVLSCNGTCPLCVCNRTTMFLDKHKFLFFLVPPRLIRVTTGSGLRWQTLHFLRRINAAPSINNNFHIWN
jgi:hypothetical protein